MKNRESGSPALGQQANAKDHKQNKKAFSRQEDSMGWDGGKQDSTCFYQYLGEGENLRAAAAFGAPYQWLSGAGTCIEAIAANGIEWVKGKG